MKNILFLGTTIEERLRYPALTQVTCLRLQTYFLKETDFSVFLLDGRNEGSEFEQDIFGLTIKYIPIRGDFNSLDTVLPDVEMDMIADDFSTTKFINVEKLLAYIEKQQNLSVISMRDLIPNQTRTQKYDHITLQGPIKLYVKNLDGQTRTIYVSKETTIENIKKVVYGNPNINLIFAGKTLKNDNTIGDYEFIVNESTLHISRTLAIEDTAYTEPLERLGFKCKKQNGDYIITRIQNKRKRSSEDDDNLEGDVIFWQCVK